MSVNNLGMVRPGSTIIIPFAAFDSNDPSASVIISAFALADIGIYKGTSMTERGSTTGVVLLDTDGINIDGATGIHGFTIDLSSNATAGFYSSGSHYYVTVGPITIDGATINFVAATFSIGYPDAIINTTIASVTDQTQFILTVGPAEADVLIGCSILFHDVASAVQLSIGYITDYIVTTKEVFIAADPGGFTFVATDNVSIFMPANVRAVGGTLQTAGDLAALITTVDTVVDTIAVDVAGIDGVNLAALFNALVLTTATIETVTSQTVFVLPATADATDNDVYNGAVAVFIDGTDPNQKSIRLITDYVASSRSVTVSEAPDFTITTADTLTILSSSTARLLWQLVLTGADQNVTNSAGRRVRVTQESGSYSLGHVYIDTVGGTAGTTDFENGVDIKPVDSIGDANTIATSIGLDRFSVSPASSITFAASQADDEFHGENWTLALGGQAIGGIHVSGAEVSGTGTCASEAHFEHCELGTMTIGIAHFDECDIEGTVTLAGAGTYRFFSCMHSGAAVIDFGTAVGVNMTVHIHGYNGALTIENLGTSGTDVLHFDSSGGQLTLAASCVGGTLNFRGTAALVNNGSGITINRGGDVVNDVAGVQSDTDNIQTRIPTTLVSGRMDASIDATGMESGAVDNIWNRDATSNQTAGTFGEALGDPAATGESIRQLVGEFNAAAAAGDPSTAESVMQYVKQIVNILAGSAGIGTFPAAADPANGVSMAEVLRRIFDDTDPMRFTVANQLDANAVAISASTAAADNLEASAEVIVIGAAEAGTLSTTQMTTDLTEATDEHYNGRIVIWTSGVLLGQASDITAYLGSTGRLTYTAVTEAPSAADTFVIV